MSVERITHFVNALLCTGDGSEPVLGSLEVRGDRILRVSPGDPLPATPPGADRLDCAGQVLSPGFLDVHAHSDLHLLSHPEHEAKLRQGVTFELLGQDGLGYAPVNDKTLPILRERIRAWNGDPAGFAWSWRSVGQYLSRLDEGIAVNAGVLVPHGNLRLLVMGDAPRAAAPDEIAQMAELLRAGLREGALGLSAGLTYVPGTYANTEELIELCRVVAAADGVFVPHHRNYGATALEGYTECLEIARATGVRLHLAHTHLSFPANAGKLPELLDIFAAAEADGVDFSFDSYPYLAGMTTLASQLPSWAQAGTVAEQIVRLRDPERRAAIIEALNVTGSDGHQGLTVDWDTVHLAGVAGAADYAWALGGSLAAAAAARDQEPADLCLDILIASEMAAPCVLFMGVEAHVRELMQHPAHTVGSDGIFEGSRPHPRAWGTFARMLGHYVRELGVLSLGECVRHMTDAPAQRLGFSDRGRLRAGAIADLVVFDPDLIQDRATYDEPKRHAIGVTHVMVNGRFALRAGSLTGTRAGRVVRPNSWEQHP